MDGETCAFQFSLWDETTQVDGTLDRDLAVSEGRFTVMLDFGDVFDGTVLDLQIAAQCPGDADFITLAPRQALTAAPYAAYSRVALWNRPHEHPRRLCKRGR